MPDGVVSGSVAPLAAITVSGDVGRIGGRLGPTGATSWYCAHTPCVPYKTQSSYSLRTVCVQFTL